MTARGGHYFPSPHRPLSSRLEPQTPRTRWCREAAPRLVRAAEPFARLRPALRIAAAHPAIPVLRYYNYEQVLKRCLNSPPGTQ
ncbi:unnamed protein product [Colias eurytheme]|nr:unnamed protein product [Colias eurytheme]